MTKKNISSQLIAQPNKNIFNYCFTTTDRPDGSGMEKRLALLDKARS